MKFQKSLIKTCILDQTRPSGTLKDAIGYSAYITSANIQKAVASPAEFVDFAESVDAASVVHELARLNVMLQVEDHGNQILQREIAKNFLPPSTHTKYPLPLPSLPTPLRPLQARTVNL